MNDTPTFYLHIGLMKTGTTSIQHYLYLNRDKLKNQGIFFPDGKKISPYIRHRNWNPAQNSEYKKIWHDTVKNSKEYNKIIISAEGFSFLSTQNIKRIAQMLESENIKIISYFRRYDHFIKSWYQERVKAKGETLSLEDFTDKAVKRINYFGIIEKWTNIFGIDNFIPRIYSPDGFDSITDFCSVCGIDTRGFKPLEQNRNVSFTESMVNLKYQINRSEKKPEIQLYITKTMKQNRQLFNTEIEESTVSFTKDQLESINNQITSISKKYNWDFTFLLPSSTAQKAKSILNSNDFSSDTANLIQVLAKKGMRYDIIKNKFMLKPIFLILNLFKQ